MELHVVQQLRRVSNFNQPLSKFLERLIQKGLLWPLTFCKPLNLNVPGYDPNNYSKFYQVNGHPTDTCVCLKYEIQNIIDAEKIINPEKSNQNPSTKNNLFPNYWNVPPLTTMMINSGVSEEEVLSSFKDLNFKTNEKSPDAPTDEEKVEKPLTAK